MVNARRDFYARAAVLCLAAVCLTSIAWKRGAEYDEQYTAFVTSGTARPIWPITVFPAGDVARAQAGHAGFVTIARDLRRTDVHPPLYFWAVALWRYAAGDGLFAVRLLSVLFGLGALTATGIIARQTNIPPPTAMLLTLGCYGFAYTAAIARGFALAQMLTMVGLATMLSGRRFLAGGLLGAAIATNYLAAFVAATLALGAGPGRWRVIAGCIPGILTAGWFFIAQRGSRTGQFPPFAWLPALARLVQYTAANLTGGLPLYVPEASHIPVAAALALGLLAVLAWIVRRLCQRPAIPSWHRLAAAALAPPAGLLVLGLVFDNTPIELRYLSFATPFVALLVAAARLPTTAMAAIFAVQAASLAGLALRPETMQPATATAQAATAFLGQGVVLLPRGNDGVGIVGAFAASVPPDTPLLLVAPDESPEALHRRLRPFRRIVVAALAQDADSRTALPIIAAALQKQGCDRVGSGFNVVAYQCMPTDERRE